MERWNSLLGIISKRYEARRGNDSLLGREERQAAMGERSGAEGGERAEESVAAGW